MTYCVNGGGRPISSRRFIDNIDAFAEDKQIHLAPIKFGKLKVSIKTAQCMRYC